MLLGSIKNLNSRILIEKAESSSQQNMMSPKQALVIAPMSIGCAILFAYAYCSNADEIAESVTRHDIGRLYLLTLALPFAAFMCLGLISVAVLGKSLVRRLAKAE